MPSEGPRTREARAQARPIRDLYLRAVPYCELAALPGFPPCLGALHVHEPYTRARGGPIDDPRNMATACDYHNEYIGQDARGMAAGLAAGLLIKRARGPEWMAAGGRMPGLSRDEAIEIIRRKAEGA